MKIVLVGVAVASLCLGLANPCFADAEAVNKYLGQATELVAKGPQFFDDATSKLELAEASMDDVPEADKPALKAKIDALKAQMAQAAAAGDKERVERDIRTGMEELEGLVGNLVAWPGKAEEMTKLLDDPKTTAALGADQVAKLKKQFATMQKLHQTKALKENLANATTQLDELEKTWAENKTKAAEANNAQDRANTLDMERDFESIERTFKDLPADNADVKGLRARLDKIKAENATAVGSAGASGVIEQINRYFELYADEFKGMDEEKGDVTWADFKANRGDARELNLKQTGNYLRRVPTFLTELQDREDYKAVKDAPEVKAKVADIEKKLEAARARAKKAIDSLVSEFEKEKATRDNVGDGMTLGQQAKFFLGQEDPDAQAIVARVDKVFKEGQASADKAEADKLAYYKTMTEQANKAWPGMMSSYTIADGFDPNNAAAHKGKYIKIVSNNLMGWRFKHGDFPYATKINGVPVAGNYDPAVKAALAEVEAKLGRAIGDNDEDGEWTAIARVEGSTGKLVELVRSTGDVKVDGSNVGTVEATDERVTDAPIVTIVAVKAGPVAAAAGQGAVKEDGSVGKSSAPGGGALAAGSTSGGRGFSPIPFVMGLFAIVVAAACLMKARFAPLATNAGAVQLTEKVGGQNLQYVGLAGIVLGAIGVLMNILAILAAPMAAVIGILASLAMLVAGGVAARDFFEERKIMPGSIAPVLTQFAVPAGLACAVLGVLTVIVAL